MGRNRETGKATEGKESDRIGRKKNGKERQRGKIDKEVKMVNRDEGEKKIFERKNNVKSTDGKKRQRLNGDRERKSGKNERKKINKK